MIGSLVLFFMTTRSATAAPILVAEAGAGVDLANLAIITSLANYGLLDSNLLSYNVVARAVPEPGTLLLLGAGVAGVIVRMRRRTPVDLA